MEFVVPKMTERRFDKFRPELREEIKKLVKREVRSAKKHLKTAGWNLSVDIINSNICYDLLGEDLLFYLMQELNEIKGARCYFEGLEITLKNDDYIPVSYDSVKNRIVLGLFKSELDDSFIYLGCL